MSQIHELLPKVAAEIGVIEKTQRADRSVGAYPFRGVDDVTAAYHEPFFRHGLILHSKVMEWEMRDYVRDDGKPYHQAIVVMRYRFEAPDESSVSVEAVGASIDYQDKAAGQAMSQALKVALLQAVLSPPGGVDPDARGPYPTAPAQSEQRVPRAEPGEEFCPACFLKYGERIALSVGTKPAWRCQAPPDKCGGSRQHQGKTYSWAGWSESWEKSVTEWGSKTSTDVGPVLGVMSSAAGGVAEETNEEEGGGDDGQSA